jgi:hypothetical protein
VSIYEKLLSIQTELKVPKSQYNKFGGYNYRNCEDILETLKPLLKQHNATVLLTDEIENIGDRFYVRVNATFIDIESGEKVTVSALAREDLSKKGMDSSQVTGSTSSYARKYALNGLFCIDDNRDADTLNNSKEYTAPPKAQKQPTKPVQPPKQASNVIICPVCGKPVQPAKVKDGSGYIPADVIIKQYGKCSNCVKAERHSNNA